MKGYITYWKDVAKELDNPFPPMPCKMQHNFWPSTAYATTNASTFDAIQVDTTS